MIDLCREFDVDGLRLIHSKLFFGFRDDELVDCADFVYHARNYGKLHNGEDYCVCWIVRDGIRVGMISYFLFDEFLFVDYMMLFECYRDNSFVVLREVLGLLEGYGKAILLEAESDVLCRLYSMGGFKLFDEDYEYIGLVVNQVHGECRIECHRSHLMFRGELGVMSFGDIVCTIREKYYLRWNEIYPEKYLVGYRVALGFS